MTLAHHDLASGGDFGDSLATISGVSGGSLGIAAWLAARERTDLSHSSRIELLAQYLGSDFLSPMVAGFLFLDMPRLLLGPLWFQARRDHVFEVALADRWRELAGTDFFALRFSDLCFRSFKRVPAIYFNATDAETGTYVPLTHSPFSETNLLARSPRLGGAVPDFNLGSSSLAGATVSQIVHTSARFPYLSPPANVGFDASRWRLSHEPLEEAVDATTTAPRSPAWARNAALVDGGYFDNTGLIPTSVALSIVAEKRRQEIRFNPKEGSPFLATRFAAVHISNAPVKTCTELPHGWRNLVSRPASRYLEVSKFEPDCAEQVRELEAAVTWNPFSILATPLQAIVSVRDAHSRQAIQRLQEWSEGRKGGDFFDPRSDSFESAFTYARDGRLFVGIPTRTAFGVGPVSLGQSDTEAVETKVRWLKEQPVGGSRLVSWTSKDEAWANEMRAEAARTACGSVSMKNELPLGWTLSNANQAQLRCIAFWKALALGRL